MFIAFEGIDGSGKTTISGMVRDELVKNGHNVFLTREPTENIVWNDELKRGRDARSGLSLFFRFTEDRFSHQEEIRKHLESGEIVLCDRFLMSSLAYQGALIEELFENRESTLKWMENVSGIITIRPDITLHFDVAPAVSMQRLATRSELTGFEEKAYLERVSEFYREISVNGKVTIDGSGPVAEVFNAVMKVVNSAIRP